MTVERHRSVSKAYRNVQGDIIRNFSSFKFQDILLTAYLITVIAVIHSSYKVISQVNCFYNLGVTQNSRKVAIYISYLFNRATCLQH